MKGLILDDDHAVCDCIASSLEASAVEYRAFVDPIAALEKMRSSKYDFAFVDIQLPNMNGLEFSKRFRDAFPEADVIFITGHGDYEKAVRAIKVGAYDYLQKPFSHLDIALCVSRLLEKRRLFENQKRMEVLRFANQVALELMHELRNPLVAIGGFSRLISKRRLSEDRMRRFADIVFEESVRLEAVLKEILNHLKGGRKLHGSGQTGHHREVFDRNQKGANRGTAARNTIGETTTWHDTTAGQRRVSMTKRSKKAAGGKKTAVKRRKNEISVAAGNGPKKEYLSDKNVCKVTFRLPKLAAHDAQSVSIVGDFNGWDVDADPMRRLKNGDYAVKLELKSGKEYQFRYLIDRSKWENDWNADDYVKSPFGDSDNSVVKV